MFEISQLRCFVAVSEELHFGRAAERLHMTQPPLSRQIRLLEHQVGTPLLERTNRVVRFTAAGKAFFPEAARILRLADEAATTARRIAKGEKGSMAIGFLPATDGPSSSAPFKPSTKFASRLFFAFLASTRRFCVRAW